MLLYSLAKRGDMMFFPDIIFNENIDSSLYTTYFPAVIFSSKFKYISVTDYDLKVVNDMMNKLIPRLFFTIETVYSLKEDISYKEEMNQQLFDESILNDDGGKFHAVLRDNKFTFSVHALPATIIPNCLKKNRIIYDKTNIMERMSKNG